MYILFDLDGTLVDTSEGIIESIKHTLQELGITDVEAKDFRRFIGPPLPIAFTDHCGFSKERATEATTTFRKYYDAGGKYICEIYPGMEDTLRFLKEKGHTLVVATSKPTVFAEDILEHVGIGKYFDRIVGSNLDNTRNAKHEIIRYILNMYGVDNLDDVVMIGDKAQDLIGADKCAVHGIGVTYGFGSHEELAHEKNDAILSSPSEIREYFSQMMKG